MIHPRKIQCDICGKVAEEKGHGEGWPTWGKIFGKQNEKGETEFCLCPNHLDKIFEFIKRLKEDN